MWVSINSPSSISWARSMIGQGDDSVRNSKGAIVSLCSCTLYELFSKFTVITKLMDIRTVALQC